MSLVTTTHFKYVEINLIIVLINRQQQCTKALTWKRKSHGQCSQQELDLRLSYSSVEETYGSYWPLK